MEETEKVTVLMLYNSIFSEHVYIIIIIYAWVCAKYTFQ